MVAQRGQFGSLPGPVLVALLADSVTVSPAGAARWGR
jgi:hypothetical protein